MVYASPANYLRCCPVVCVIGGHCFPVAVVAVSCSNSTGVDRALLFTL